MKKQLKIDIDIKKREDGGLDVTSDFSDYIANVRQEYIESINAAILDSIEPQLNALGWVKEQTCTMEKKQTWCFTGLVCSKCGRTTFYRYAEPGEDGMVIRCPGPNYCPYCGAKVVEE